VAAVLRWPVASNDRAVANARAATTECSRLRVERAEVEQFLDSLRVSASGVTAKAAASGR
jgi:hypothetical protein